MANNTCMPLRTQKHGKQQKCAFGNIGGWQTTQVCRWENMKMVNNTIMPLRTQEVGVTGIVEAGCHFHSQE